MHYDGWNFRGMPNRSRKEDLMNREINQPKNLSWYRANCR